MSTVAIAGGSGSLGLYVVDELLSQKIHKVIVLSRKENPELSARGVTVRVIDYDSLPSLTSALQGVDALISFIFAKGDSGTTAQLNLIKVCEEVGVKRFIPSEWAADVKQFPDKPKGYEFKVPIRSALPQSKLEYTFICNGLFMDYLLPTGSKKYLRDVRIPVDIPNARAEIPGTGTEPVTLTRAEDIAKAVGQLINEKSKWPEYTYIIGSTTTWNQVVKIAEEVTGKKFDVSYTPLDELKRSLAEAEASGDFMKAFYSEVNVFYAIGGLALPANENDIFGNLNFVGVEEFLRNAYGKKN